MKSHRRRSKEEILAAAKNVKIPSWVDPPMVAKPERRESLCRTSDDWAPNFDQFGKGDKDGDRCKVLFIELPARGWRVRVTGADDEAWERDFPSNDRALALLLWTGITHWALVNVSELRKYNFVRG